MVGVAAPTEEAAAEGGGEGHRGVSQVVIDEFTKHANAMRESSRARRDAVRLRSVVDDDHDAVAVDIRDTLGVPQPQDKWQGCTNLRTLRTLLSIVDDRGFERSPHQIAFHSAFERCVSRVVYKKDWGTSRPAIMRKNEWKRCSSEVLISTPRRFGKTFSIAIFCACLALSFGTEIVVFSPARRASRKLLERMVEFIRLLDGDDLIVEYNQEQCRVKSYDGRSSLIRSFPSKVGSLKGVSGDIIVLEEAAYCDPGLISEVIVPLLSMQQSCLLCISTLLESGNHYSRMFELKDQLGEPLFETISITLVCEDCMKTDHPENCTHKLAEMPRWLSSAKMEVVKSLLADDPAMLLRESMGIGADSTQKAFYAQDIQGLLDRPGIEIPRHFYEPDLQENTRHVCVAVDPAGGGASAFAVSSLVQLPNGTIVVLGLDTLRTKDVRETHKLVCMHIAAIRKIKNLHDCTIVLCLESNLAFEAQHIIHTLQEQGLKKWVALQEGAGQTLGWLTTNERKESMCMLTRDALRLGNISFSNEFFCTTQTVKLVKQQLEDELRNFCILVEPAKTPFGKVKRTYSGKVGGRQDDLIIALQLAITGIRTFYQQSRYQSFRSETNKGRPVPMGGGQY